MGICLHSKCCDYEVKNAGIYSRNELHFYTCCKCNRLCEVKEREYTENPTLIDIIEHDEYL